MNDRTIKVSKSRPNAIVVPTWAITFSGLKANVAIVAAKTRPAEVTTEPEPATARICRLQPGVDPFFNRDISSRL